MPIDMLQSLSGCYKCRVVLDPHWSHMYFCTDASSHTCAHATWSCPLIRIREVVVEPSQVGGAVQNGAAEGFNLAIARNNQLARFVMRLERPCEAA